MPRHARARDLVVQIVALQQLHREEHVFAGRAEIADVDHVLVADTRRRFRLLDEAIDEVRLARELAVQDLERDLLLENVVRREVDRAHAAFAELFLDRVAIGERRTDQLVLARRQVRRLHRVRWRRGVVADRRRGCDGLLPARGSMSPAGRLP